MSLFECNIYDLAEGRVCVHVKAEDVFEAEELASEYAAEVGCRHVTDVEVFRVCIH